MATRTVTLDEFRDHWLELLDDVEKGGEEVVVLRQGKAIARVTSPARRDLWSSSLIGTASYDSEEDLLAPTVDEWDIAAERDEDD